MPLATNVLYQEIVVSNTGRHRAVAELVAQHVWAGEWPAIVFCFEHEHAEQQARVLKEVLRLDVPVVTGETPRKRRKEIAEAMRRRDVEMPVVVATEVWSTGLDIPSLAAGYNAGGRSAPIGLRQRVGRVLRRHREKRFKWYDIVDKTSGVGTFDDHNAKRLEHYERAGFSVAQHGPSVRTTLDQRLMQRLLEEGAAPRQQLKPAPQEASRRQTGSYIGALFTDAFFIICLIALAVLATTDVCH
jgi:superfamily II DNA or RNA helicase